MSIKPPGRETPGQVLNLMLLAALVGCVAYVTNIILLSTR
jgi:hypothetical protein